LFLAQSRSRELNCRGSNGFTPCVKMPKNKTAYSDLIKKFGKGVFTCDDNLVLCKMCSKSFLAARKFILDQHVKTSGHKEALKRQETQKEKKQQLLSSKGPSLVT
jgi:hypothetical protein